MDPFPDHAPAVVTCADGAIEYDPGSLDISTGDCDYVLLSQPLPVALDVGDTLRIQYAHLMLYDPAGGGLSHIALAIADAVVWEAEVAVPSQARAYDQEVTLDRGFDAGSPVVLHLHNHGTNEWRFYDTLWVPSGSGG